MTTSVPLPEWVVGRYQVFEEIASGGMATVHYGRLVGPVGFSRVVAIKRLHPHLAKDPEFVAMFIDEARLAAKIRHPNVVPMLDVVVTDDHLLLVMEYVQGETLSRLIRLVRAQTAAIPPPIAASIIVGTLYGLHAAHEAKSDKGEPLGLVHRDVSPQNIIVGSDGVARVLDFGIAKAAGRLQTTREGRLKGKLSYMAPEHIRGEHVTRAADIYATAVVLWEALAGERLFSADNDADLLEQVLKGQVSEVVRGRNHDRPDRDDFETMPTALHRVVLRGLAPKPADRYATAHEMARAIEQCTRVASAGEVSEWVERIAGEGLAAQARKFATISLGDTSGQNAVITATGAHASDEDGASVAAVVAAATAASSALDGADKPGHELREAMPGAVRMVGLSTSAKAKASSRSRWPLSVFVTAIVAVAVLFFWMHHSAKVTHDVIAPPPPTSATVASSAEPDDQELELDPVPTGGPDTPSQPNSRHRHAPVHTAVPGHDTKSPCNPPYVIDPQGVKHYKVECL